MQEAQQSSWQMVEEAETARIEMQQIAEEEREARAAVDKQYAEFIESSKIESTQWQRQVSQHSQA